jgi:F420-0:gamma-glutamyl ligase-like protein
MAKFGSFDTPTTTEEQTNTSSIYSVPQIATNETDALEEIQTENFYNTLKSYYSYREADNSFNNMPHADLLDYFYEDRSWRNNNTVSMGMDMANVFGEEDEKRLAEFSYIQQTYAQLPSFWNDPNRTFGSWLIDNGGAMLSDPVNLIGLGVGGQAAKQGYKQALRVALKDKVAGELNERALKEVAKQTQKQALGKAIVKGGLYEGAVNTVIAGGQDALLQTTNIEAGIQDKYNYGRSAIASAAGFGFGTAFGSAFSAGAFKLTTNSLQRKGVKKLLEIEAKGQSNISGARLFDELMPDETTKTLRNKPPVKTTKEYINKLETDKITPEDKPAGKNELPINLTKQRGKYEAFVKNKTEEVKEQLKKEVITREQMVNEVVTMFGQDRKKFEAMANDMANSEQFVKAYATIIAQADDIRSDFDMIGALSTQLSQRTEDLAPDEIGQILNKIEAVEQRLDKTIVRKKKSGQNIARALQAGNVDADATRAAELIANPEDPKMIALKRGTPEQRLEFYKTVGKLADRDQIIRALQNAKEVDRWDIATEFVNNNLLSSPDTHILNIVSGLVQTQWKPLTMLLRGANMLRRDSDRAKVIMREALQTYIYQYAYIGHALKRASKSFVEGRAILDSRQMKHDSTMRQGQLQDLFDAWGETVTNLVGLDGTTLGKMVTGTFKGAGRVVSAPMRVLSAGDEFLKSMMFKARMTSLINSKILEESPDLMSMKNDFTAGYSIPFREKYKAKAREIEAQYIKDNGSAIEVDKTVNARLNSPLYYAQEGSYTQHVGQINPNTKALEDKLTGSLLRIATKHKSLRLLGLHFVNTPSNLLRWSAQHLPFLGRFQFQMAHMLAEKKLGNGKFRSEIARGLNPFRKKDYINPEAAAEAKARIQMGWALWGSAVYLAMSGKIVGGGDINYKKQKDKEANTGEQPYSYKTDDGRYISLNRLDPIMMPFFIAADVIALLNKHLETTDDLDPVVEKDTTELIMGVVATLTRNITSKFYTKNLLEVVHMMTSDDIMFSRKPERFGTQVLSQFAYKAFPLSGGSKICRQS